MLNIKIFANRIVVILKRQQTANSKSCVNVFYVYIYLLVLEKNKSNQLDSKKTNEEVLCIAQEKLSLLKIRRGKMFRYLVRYNSFLRNVMEGNFEGKRQGKT